MTFYIYAQVSYVSFNNYYMDEPLLTPRQSMQLPPEFLMPVPFCQLIYETVCWAFCECGICACCII